ncbi:hypothetical protein [uncultured Shewanella sp.]|uniref:hypothetical protein n=1 Tax=uncultured Shewanella sp. TaxID=173975 RepID=UPI0026388F6C|nr:hypothetical protein [uncultured Shewanella sp.]
MNISDYLLNELIDWVEYLDGEPSIENNDDFCNLRNNRPDWTFDMCAVYWKFAYQLTEESFSETPCPHIKKTVKYATELAFKKSPYFNNNA